MNPSDTFVAFYGDQHVITAALADMLASTKHLLNEKQASSTDTEALLIFNERTGEQVDFDFRGSEAQVFERALPKAKARAVGRPKLGVTSREISLLPRHWEWLERQPKSISATLRLLVEEASRRERASSEAQIQQALAVTDRIMQAIAGNLANFEEASRALNSRDMTGFETQVAGWPKDIKAYVLKRFQHIVILS